MQIRIWVNDKNTPVGKVADAELQFTQEDGMLCGLKLVGFAVWESRGGRGFNVTFPARAYSVNGERRSFQLLRPTSADAPAHDAVRQAIIDEYTRVASRAGQQQPPAPRREPRYVQDEHVQGRRSQERIPLVSRRSASPAIPRSAMRAFNNRHED